MRLSPWDIHLPQFLELFLDAVAHAAPEPDENCSAPVQGQRGIGTCRTTTKARVLGRPAP